MYLDDSEKVGYTLVSNIGVEYHSFFEQTIEPVHIDIIKSSEAYKVAYCDFDLSNNNPDSKLLFYVQWWNLLSDF